MMVKGTCSCPDSRLSEEPIAIDFVAAVTVPQSEPGPNHCRTFAGFPTDRLPYTTAAVHSFSIRSRTQQLCSRGQTYTPPTPPHQCPRDLRPFDTPSLGRPSVARTRSHFASLSETWLVWHALASSCRVRSWLFAAASPARPTLACSLCN